MCVKMAAQRGGGKAENRIKCLPRIQIQAARAAAMIAAAAYKRQSGGDAQPRFAVHIA
jgi:hypothetical protein